MPVCFCMHVHLCACFHVCPRAHVCSGHCSLPLLLPLLPFTWGCEPRALRHVQTPSPASSPRLWLSPPGPLGQQAEAQSVFSFGPNASPTAQLKASEFALTLWAGGTRGRDTGSCRFPIPQWGPGKVLSLRSRRQLSAQLQIKCLVFVDPSGTPCPLTKSQVGRAPSSRGLRRMEKRWKVLGRREPGSPAPGAGRPPLHSRDPIWGQKPRSPTSTRGRDLPGGGSGQFYYYVQSTRMAGKTAPDVYLRAGLGAATGLCCYKGSTILKRQCFKSVLSRAAVPVGEPTVWNARGGQLSGSERERRRPRSRDHGGEDGARGLHLGGAR